jgi:hypothetical protein
MALLPPVINVGPDGRKAWLQAGLKYGRNESGLFQSFSKEGPQAEVEDYAIMLDNAGWTWTVERLKGGLARIDGHAGWGNGSSSTYTTEQVENIWEFDPNESDKALLETDFPNGSLNLNNTGSHLTRLALSKMVNDDDGFWETAPPGGVFPYFRMSDGTVYIFDSNAPGAYRPADLGAVKFVGLQKDDFETAYSLYLLMRANTTAFPLATPVIRHTALVSNQYAVQASFTNVGRIISSASMISLEGVPTTLLFSIPSPPGQDTGGAPEQYIEDPGDLQYGWRKIFPGVTRLARFKWRITENWIFGLYPIKMFGPVL